VQAISLASMLRYTQFDQVYHEHLTYWTVHSLDHLFALYGLEIFSADMLPIHGGSMELLVAPRGTQKVDASVEKMRAEEKELGCDKIETYKKFAERVWQIEKELLPILRDFHSNGKKVYAFGAPAKGATLLNSFHITTDLVQCAVEVNPLKIGKYIPGVRLPILDEGEMDSPDAYLILAWNFLKEFLPKKKDYILNGGEFIVPIPSLNVINKYNYIDYV
jgi:hypothetical protein